MTITFSVLCPNYGPNHNLDRHCPHKLKFQTGQPEIKLPISIFLKKLGSMMCKLKQNRCVFFSFIFPFCTRLLNGAGVGCNSGPKVGTLSGDGAQDGWTWKETVHSESYFFFLTTKHLISLKSENGNVLQTWSEPIENFWTSGNMEKLAEHVNFIAICFMVHHITRAVSKLW